MVNKKEVISVYILADFKHQKRFVLYFCWNIKYKFGDVTER